MTLEEVTGCILQRHPTHSRLGIPLFNWRQEANRGLIGYSAVTVWPTPLGLAASFNPELVEKAASDLGDEVRAVVNRDGARDPVNGMKDGPQVKSAHPLPVKKAKETLPGAPATLACLAA